MRIIVKKANVDPIYESLGREYINQAIFWKEQAAFSRKFNDIEQSVECCCRAEERLKEASVCLGFSSVNDMVWWYKKRCGINL